ncbi:hypothetical protein Q8A73_011424 [Channa argus]|nr:hypothetical protein Q8A73_011424 [Channa argus]
MRSRSLRSPPSRRALTAAHRTSSLPPPVSSLRVVGAAVRIRAEATAGLSVTFLDKTQQQQRVSAEAVNITRTAELPPLRPAPGGGEGTVRRGRPGHRTCTRNHPSRVPVRV